MSFIGSMFGGSSGAGFQAKGLSEDQLNQSYNQNQSLAAQMAAQNGLGNQSNVYNQLQGVVAGQGPNPAQAQLAQATGQNVANQAALMAGQRGASQNVGLMGRQAAQQGSNIQQQAAGQAATMQANQSLNALGQAGGMANQMAAQQQNQLQNLLGTTANSVAGQNTANAGIAAGNQKAQAGLLGGLMGGVGSALGMASGGGVPSSGFGKFLSGAGNTFKPAANEAEYGAGYNMGTGIDKALGGLGSVIGKTFAPKPTMMAGEPMSAAPIGMQLAYSGGSIDYRSGGKLPGKADVKGDSLKNDKVPIMGSPGEIMLPRSVTMHPNAPDEAKKFVQAIMAKQSLGKNK